MLSGTPTFNGLIAVLFSKDQFGVGFDGEFIEPLANSVHLYRHIVTTYGDPQSRQIGCLVALAGSKERMMNVIEARSFQGRRAWEALNIANIDGVTVRLHWTDQPYIWHVNDGPEVFVVLDGS